MSEIFRKLIYALAGAGLFFLIGTLGINLLELKASTAENTAIQKELVNVIKDITVDINTLKENSKVAGGEDFENSVIKAIENYAKVQQSKEAEQKFANYENAPDGLIDGKHIYGSVNARFTIAEFSDTECPYCKRFHPTVKEIVDQSNGQVNWEWRHMPLSFHDPYASVQGHAAECVGDIAGNKAFWVFLDEIFKKSKGNGQGVENLLSLATDLGVDGEEFKTCMSETRFRQKIEDDKALGVSLGINGTPASILTDNTTGKTIPLNGAQPKSAVMSALRSLQDAQSTQ